MAALGVVAGVLLKWAFDYFLGSPRWKAENSSTGLAIQLEQVKRDAAARAESDSGRVARLEEEATALKARLNDKQSAKEISDLKRALADHEKASEAQKFEFTKELNHTSSELERMTRERMKLEQQLTDFEQKILRANEVESILAERDTTVKTLQSALDKSAQELASAKQSLQSLRPQLDQLERIQAERNELAIQVENQETTINKLRSSHQAELKELDIEKSNLSAELEIARASAENENSGLIAQLTALRDEWTEREQALTDEVSEIAAVHQGRVHELEAERAQLVKTRADLSQEVARLTQQLAVVQPNWNDGPTLDGQTVGVPGARPKIYLKAATRRDPLYQIKGIGPVFEQKFFSAGITKFSELADLSDDRIKDIIGVDAWQKVDGTAWVAEAAERSAGIA